jgi:hypothetical protein
MSLNKFLENWAVGCGANQSLKTIPSVRGTVGERPHQQLSLCGEWSCVNSSSPLSGHRPHRQSSARSLMNINSECPSRGSKSCVARNVQVDCLLEVEWCRARKTVKDHQEDLKVNPLLNWEPVQAVPWSRLTGRGR